MKYAVVLVAGANGFVDEAFVYRLLREKIKQMAAPCGEAGLHGSCQGTYLWHGYSKCEKLSL